MVDSIAAHPAVFKAELGTRPAPTFGDGRRRDVPARGRGEVERACFCVPAQISTVLAASRVFAAGQGAKTQPAQRVGRSVGNSAWNIYNFPSTHMTPLSFHVPRDSEINFVQLSVSAFSFASERALS